MTNPNLAPIMRYIIGGGVLCATILVAPALTIWHRSVHTNDYIGSLQWLFILLMAPELLRGIQHHLASSLAFRLLVVSLLVCMSGWIAQGMRPEEIDRTWFYVAQPLFVLAASAWFRWAGDEGLKALYWAKFAATAAALTYLFTMLWLAGVPDLDWRQVKRLPIYRNIRHLSYDLAIVASLGVLFWPTRKTLAVASCVALFMLIGGISVWSAGRGQMLSYFAFLGIFFVLMSSWSTRKALLAPLTSFIAGGLALFVLNPDLVMWIFGKSSAGTANEISSGRIEVWISTLRTFENADLLGFFVGLGPDAFIRLAVYPKLVQPHNAPLQLLLEFGIVGLAAITLAALAFATSSYQLLKASETSTRTKGAIAAISALALYSLIDGIFYHASPFIASMLLIAFVISKTQPYRQSSFSCRGEDTHQHMNKAASR